MDPSGWADVSAELDRVPEQLRRQEALSGFRVSTWKHIPREDGGVTIRVSLPYTGVVVQGRPYPRVDLYVEALLAKMQEIAETGRLQRERYLKTRRAELEASIAVDEREIQAVLEKRPQLRQPAEALQVFEGFEEELPKLKQQAAELHIQLAAQNARLASLREWIASRKIDAEHATESDPVVAELTQIVQLREARLSVLRKALDPAAQAEQYLEYRRGQLAAELKRKTEQDPDVIALRREVERSEQRLAELRKTPGPSATAQDNVAEGEEALARAKAELARQRQVTFGANGGDLIAELTRDLTLLNIDTVETRARENALFDAYWAVRLRLMRNGQDAAKKELAKLVALPTESRPASVKIVRAENSAD
jgi:hypothetical protein